MNVKITYILIGLIFTLFAFRQSLGGTVQTCAQFQAVTVGSYVIQTDYWNKKQCPGTQCVSVDDQTGAFTVTKGDFECTDPYGVATYPSIVYGYAWGVRSHAADLPAKVSSMKSVKSSWSFVPTDTGRWDAAYDIWLAPDNSYGGPAGFGGGAEVMIWLDYRDVHGWKEDRGPVTIGGMTWEVWDWNQEEGAKSHKYVAYLAKTLTTSVKNLDIKDFLNDCLKRGFIKPSWYLYAVEAGLEIHSGGVPFTSKIFSVAPSVIK